MSTSTQSDPTVWEYYNEQAKIEDTDLRKDWDINMDVLLIFAALFSAILTAFVVDTYHKLELNDTQILLAISAQLANPQRGPFRAEAFTPDPKDVVVNAMFFSSLSCSLVTAMGAMLVKQWVRNYARGLGEMDEPRRRALARHRRFIEILRWKLPDLVALLPLIMQLSLGLFFAGLGILLFHNTVIFSIIISLFGLGATIFFVTALISARFPDAPFRTPVSHFIRWFFYTPMLARPADNAQSTELKWEALDWLAKKSWPTPKTSKKIFSIISAISKSCGRWEDMKGKEHWKRLVGYVLDHPSEALKDGSRPLQALFLAFVNTDLKTEAKDLLERTRDILSRSDSSVEDCWLTYYYRSLSSTRFYDNAPPQKVTGTSSTEGLQHLRELVICLFPAPFFKRSDLDSLLCEYFVTPGSDEILRKIVDSKPVTQTKRFELAVHIMVPWPDRKLTKAQGAFHRGLLHFLLATAWSDSPRISSQEPSPSDSADPEQLRAVLAGFSSSEPARTMPASPQAEIRSYLIALHSCITKLSGPRGDLRADFLHALASAMMRCDQEDVSLIFDIFRLLNPKQKYGSHQVVEMLIATINSWESEPQLKCYTIFMLADYARRNKQITAAEIHGLKEKTSRDTIRLLLDMPFEDSSALPMIDDPLWKAPELMLEMSRRFDDMERSSGELSFGLHDSLFLRAALLHPSMSTSFHRKALRCLARVTQQQHPEDIPITEILSTMVIDKWLGEGDSLSTLAGITPPHAAKSVFMRVYRNWNLGNSSLRKSALKWASGTAGLLTSLTASEIDEVLASSIFRLNTAFDAVMVSTISLKLKRKNADAFRESKFLHHLKTFWKDGEPQQSANLEVLAITLARSWLCDQTALDGADIREAWEWIAEIASEELVLEENFRDLWKSPALRNILPEPTSDIERLEPLISLTIKAKTGLAQALISRDGLAWLRNISQEERHRDWSADMLNWIFEQREEGQLQRRDAEELIVLSKEIYGRPEPSPRYIDRWVEMVRIIDHQHPSAVLKSGVKRDMLAYVYLGSPAPKDSMQDFHQNVTIIQQIGDRPLTILQHFMAIIKFDKLIAWFSPPEGEASPV